MDEQKLYQVALSLIPGVGNLLAKNLISYCGSAKAVFNSPKSKLSKIPGIGPKTVESILTNRILQEAEDQLKLTEEQGAQLLAYTDPSYPNRLKQIADAPNILFYKGNVNLNAHRSVAIVGTRQASQYGKQITEQLVADLLPYEPLIISGLAYGIDITAHRAALRQGLPTLGIMASGLDIIYPAAHKATAREMLRQGGLMTENQFGSQPDAYKFPARNRIIAGLADVVIVIEAAEKGGALITADIACSYEREVFAVPGALNSPQSAGCNYLIKHHKAHMYLSIEDMADTLNWTAGPKQEEPKPQQYTQYSGPEALVLKTLREHPAGLQIDELSWRTQIPISQMASVLLTLEFGGMVRSLPGKKYTLQ